MAEKWRTRSDEEYYKAISRLPAVGYPDNELMLKILQGLITPQQCQEILYMPASLEDLVQKMGLSAEEVNKDLNLMYEGGLCNPSRKGWRIIPNYGMIRDAIAPSWKADARYDGLMPAGLVAEFEEQYFLQKSRDERPTLLEAEAKETGAANQRILSYYKAIEGVPGAEPWDDIREVIKRAQNLSVGRCACRWITGRFDVPLWNCINMGGTGLYNITRGAFRPVTYEECLEIIDKAEEAGLVHQAGPNERWTNRQICNCDDQACPLFVWKKYHESIPKYAYRSRFQTEVDPHKCKACGKCIETCLYAANRWHTYEGIEGRRSFCDTTRCVGVGACVVKCPNGARKMKLVYPPEFVPEQRSDFMWKQTDADKTKLMEKLEKKE